jgi:hypothetical protein
MRSEIIKNHYHQFPKFPVTEFDGDLTNWFEAGDLLKAKNGGGNLIHLSSPADLFALAVQIAENVARCAAPHIELCRAAKLGGSFPFSCQILTRERRLCRLFFIFPISPEGLRFPHPQMLIEVIRQTIRDQSYN